MSRWTEQFSYRLYQLMWFGLDWIFPPNCGGCETPGTRWCKGCQAAVRPVNTSGCLRCGSLSSDPGFCETCAKTHPRYSQLRSVGIYAGPLKNAIHRLKYKKDIGLGEALAAALTEHYTTLGWEADLVVPIPLSKTSQATRGYNQVALLALPLALQSAIHYRPNALARVVNTRSQVGLSALERKQNLLNAFVAEPHIVRGRRVLLLDDVLTTGSTLNAGALALIEAGAREVFGLTLARAMFR